MNKVRNIIKNIRFLFTRRLDNGATHPRYSVVNSIVPEPCFIGDDVRISDSMIAPYANFAHHAEIINSIIEMRTSIGKYTIIRNADIGKYCSISWNVTIGADSHPTQRISGHAAFFQSRFELVDVNSSKGPVPRVIIGNDVLIGCSSIIKAGVSVGNGAIIGSGSVVVKDVPSYAIVAGNPAEIIRYRFDDETIKLLQRSEWWNYRDEFIKENIDAFQQLASPELLKTLIEKHDIQN